MSQQDEAFNIYTEHDGSAAAPPPSTTRVFISHRSLDKPLAEIIAALFEIFHVHYWFDRDDQDTRNAAALGMKGEQAVVMAIDRGLRHSSHLLGILSDSTRLSWWVPYEIGCARTSNIPISFCVISSITTSSLPEFIRLCPLYASTDELLRWIAFLSGGHLHSQYPIQLESLNTYLEPFLPLQPPEATIMGLSQKAIDAIHQLDNVETQNLLRLTSQEFSWLPTTGGFIRDLAYDIFAPLAYYHLNQRQLDEAEFLPYRLLYLSITQHYEIANIDPELPYEPVTSGWRTLRYKRPAVHWLQGVSMEQLGERLRLFLEVPRFSTQQLRLATKEEFKAEFDRILASGQSQERQKLGVLINPIMGFTPQDRPVFCRILAVQLQIHQQVLQMVISSMTSGALDDVTKSLAQKYISNFSNEGMLSSQSIEKYLGTTRLHKPTRLSDIFVDEFC